jgi:hypothetical protein
LVGGSYGLQIIDVSDPSNPSLKGSYITPHQAWRVAIFGNYAYVSDGYSGLQIIDPNLNKLTLSGTPSSAGTYGIDIEACNEIKKCATDGFWIIVKDSDDTANITDTTDLTTTLTIIDSMTLGVCITCIVCFFLSLIVVGGVVMLRRHRNKILENENNEEVKELKEEKKLQKLDTSDDKKIVVDNELPRLMEEPKKPAKVNEDVELDAIPYFRED